MLAPRLGILTQVTVIVSGSPPFWGVLSSGLNSKLPVGYSASLGWMGRHLQWRVGVVGQAVPRSQCMYVEGCKIVLWCGRMASLSIGV